MNKMRQWSMLTAVAVVVVLAAGWFLGVSPQRAKATSVRAQVATQQSQNNALQVEVNQLKHMKLGLPAQQRRLAKIAERIPDNPALPVLIRQLSAAADRAGVELVSMSPSAPAAVTVTAPTTLPTTTSPTAGATPAAPATTLEKIQIALNVTGGYYNVESFFTAIEHLSRAMMVTQWTLAPGAAPSASSGSTSTSGTTSTAGSSSSSTLPDTLSGTLTAQVFESPQITAPTAAAAS